MMTPPVICVNENLVRNLEGSTNSSWVNAEEQAKSKSALYSSRLMFGSFTKDKIARIKVAIKRITKIMISLPGYDAAHPL